MASKDDEAARQAAIQHAQETQRRMEEQQRQEQERYKREHS